MTAVPRTTNAWFFMLREGDFGEQIEPVHLVFDAKIPELTSADARRAYREEAERLADALWDALPGGVVDQLVAELLSRVAVRLRVGLEPVAPRPSCGQAGCEHC